MKPSCCLNPSPTCLFRHRVPTAISLYFLDFLTFPSLAFPLRQRNSRNTLSLGFPDHISPLTSFWKFSMHSGFHFLIFSSVITHWPVFTQFHTIQGQQILLNSTDTVYLLFSITASFVPVLLPFEILSPIIFRMSQLHDFLSIFWKVPIASEHHPCTFLIFSHKCT